MRKPTVRIVDVVALLAATLGCQPDSPTAARDQLGRNAEGTVTFVLPVADTSYLVSELLASDLDTITTPGGLLGIVQTDTVTSAVGQELEFAGVGFSPFVFSYTQMLLSQEVSTTVSFPSPPPAAGPSDIPLAPGTPNDTLTFNTPGGSRILGATIASGWIVRTTVNNTVCDGTLSVALQDGNGNTIVAMPDVAVNAGQSVTDSADASGASVNRFAEVSTSATFGLCIPNPTDSIYSAITFRPMQLASVDLQNVNETFSQTYDILAGETRLTSVDTVVINSGSALVTVSNRLPVQAEVEIVLNGFRDQTGMTLRGSVIVPAAAGNGSYTSGALNFDLANVTLIPALAIADANGTASAAMATITQTAVDSAVIASGTGGITVERLSGTLDPGVTPELALGVEEFQELDPDDVDFDDLEDAIKSSTLNDGTINLSVINGANVPVIMSNFTIGVVELDAFGQVPRDPGGAPIYAPGCTGSPVLAVTDPGQSTLTLARLATSSVSLDADIVVDCLVHKLLDDQRVALLASGLATAGDGSQATITRQDVVTVIVDVVLGLDFTIPVSGVSFTRNQTADGLDLEDDEANELAERVVTAGIVAGINNTTPFFVEVTIAMVPDSVGDGVDIFARPDAVILNPVSLSAAPTDANGVPTGSVTDSVSIVLSGSDVRTVLGRIFTAGIRIRLAPRPDGSRRGAIRPRDGVAVDARVEVVVRRGNP